MDDALRDNSLFTINDCQGRTARSLNVKRRFTRVRTGLIEDLSIFSSSHSSRLYIGSNEWINFRGIDPFGDRDGSFGTISVRMSFAIRKF